MKILSPLLTEFDPAISSEGSVDPLGLYNIADSLAVMLVPGVRERQRHPRYLTAMAVSASVCSEFDEERLASDGVSEPWQVFEWYMVEGLVRTCRNDELGGLPGIDKAATAISDGVSLSAKRYLKTPKVFGFHGVYRLLANTLGILDTQGLGETGCLLLNAWMDEQGLRGFHGGSGSFGSKRKKELVSAVRDGLEKGATARSGSWNGWRFFKDHLLPSVTPPQEASVIKQALLGADSEHRRQVLEFLVSAEGQKVWTETGSERAFHEALTTRASSRLKELLGAILIYERFARLMQEAFNDCLALMTGKRGKVSPKELASSPFVERASKEVPSIYEEASRRLEPPGISSRFEESFSEFALKMSSVDWVRALLNHHVEIQKQKPPGGKAPWFEKFDDGAVIVRAGYRRDEGGRDDDDYVHFYRTRSLWTFANDLRMLSR